MQVVHAEAHRDESPVALSFLAPLRSFNTVQCVSAKAYDFISAKYRVGETPARISAREEVDCVPEHSVFRHSCYIVLSRVLKVYIVRGAVQESATLWKSLPAACTNGWIICFKFFFPFGSVLHIFITHLGSCCCM